MVMLIKKCYLDLLIADTMLTTEKLFVLWFTVSLTLN